MGGSPCLKWGPTGAAILLHSAQLFEDVLVPRPRRLQGHLTGVARMGQNHRTSEKPGPSPSREGGRGGGKTLKAKQQLSKDLVYHLQSTHQLIQNYLAASSGGVKGLKRVSRESITSRNYKLEGFNGRGLTCSGWKVGQLRCPSIRECESTKI